MQKLGCADIVGVEEDEVFADLEKSKFDDVSLFSKNIKEAKIINMNRLPSNEEDKGDNDERQGQ